MSEYKGNRRIFTDKIKHDGVSLEKGTASRAGWERMGTDAECMRKMHAE
jgi:hypothetical protein